MDKLVYTAATGLRAHMAAQANDVLVGTQRHAGTLDALPGIALQKVCPESDW